MKQRLFAALLVLALLLSLVGCAASSPQPQTDPPAEPEDKPGVEQSAPADTPLETIQNVLEDGSPVTTLRYADRTVSEVAFLGDVPEDNLPLLAGSLVTLPALFPGGAYELFWSDPAGLIGYAQFTPDGDGAPILTLLYWSNEAYETLFVERYGE